MTGLEALETFIKLNTSYDEWDFYTDEINAIEKHLKALEIIKEKLVDIWLIQNKKTLKEYNSMVDDSRKLTQEEFELLRSVLE